MILLYMIVCHTKNTKNVKNYDPNILYQIKIDITIFFFITIVIIFEIFEKQYYYIEFRYRIS